MPLTLIESSPVAFGGTITPRTDPAAIGKDILSNGTVYCLKHCFAPDAIDQLRKDIFDHFATIAPVSINYDDPALMSGNYHAIEHGVSKFQKSVHYFHAFLFNGLDQLPPHLRERTRGMFQSMVTLYNQMTGQQLDLCAPHPNGKRFRPQVFQYPSGGGMFATHLHLLEPQKLGLVLGFSRKGRDYRECSTGFEAPDGSIVDTGDAQDIGDIVVFRYDLKHWVSPCDIHQPLVDSKPGGRWSAVIPIY